jgi:ribosomal-protein-alanine N-acetyltransferase
MQFHFTEPRNLLAVIKLEKKCFVKGEAYTAKTLLEDLAERSMWGYWVGKKVMKGSVWVSKPYDDNSELYVSSLCVHPSYRGKGVGRALITKCIWHAGVHSYDFLTLHVRKSNKIAQSLYKSVGFVEHSEEEDFYENEPGLFMRLDLRKEQ